MTTEILTIRRILEGVRAKNREATILFVDFSKTFDSIHREGRWSKYYSPTAYPKKLMMLYKNTKVQVRSPDRDSDYFDIIAGVLQGDTLASYLFIICLEYGLKTSINLMKENGFKLAKKSRRYPAQTITDADYADDIVLLANTPAQTDTLLHSLERAAAGIGLHVNAERMEHVCFNQTVEISTLNGSSLKLVDKFTYLGNSVSSTETVINKWLAKVWVAIDRLSIIWKSDFTDKIKQFFSKQRSCRYCYMDTLYGR